jgi:hypothetical protein
LHCWSAADLWQGELRPELVVHHSKESKASDLMQNREILQFLMERESGQGNMIFMTKFTCFVGSLILY